ncbi:hypothetical protein NQZ79_g2178 [Umbelopsis isabellina]|nr:hypothetical protein NQZ79_g2178 [Umbelopsis isabellina]
MEATDDNNDILMSEEIGASEEIPSADSTSESAIRIQRLHAVEKTSGNAIAVLSDDLAVKELDTETYVQDKAAAFAAESRNYYALLKDIQQTLREHVGYLAKSGILTQSPNKTVPFHASVYAEQKELELWVAATHAIRLKVEEITSMANKSDVPT